MKLRYSPTSPYVRKVLVVALETGLEDRIQRVRTDPWSSESDLPADNPLGKVPALITDDGQTLFDSPVICEYLDSLHGGQCLFPASGAERWHALKLQALGDGILDAGVLRLLESKRPVERQSGDWGAFQKQAVERALDFLQDDVSAWGESITIGQVTAGCALGYLDFRFSREDWRAGRAALAAWYEGFARRASMAATVPVG